MDITGLNRYSIITSDISQNNRVVVSGKISKGQRLSYIFGIRFYGETVRPARGSKQFDLPSSARVSFSKREAPKKPNDAPLGGSSRYGICPAI